MILVDTSAFIAICDKAEGNNHRRCVEALYDFKQRNESLATTIPCLTEAMYFLHKTFGWTGQEKLWRLLEKNAFEVHHPNIDERVRMHQLMSKYKDTPMDFADASLVAAAETLKTSNIFTLDSDFNIYRTIGKKSFEIIP
ncbi:MAG: PIN domain-containing protein [Acidobacteria bacterium]|nr:PIN domain-containing protein [Acidobacteriota bacterium]